MAHRRLFFLAIVAVIIIVLAVMLWIGIHEGDNSEDPNGGTTDSGASLVLTLGG